MHCFKDNFNNRKYILHFIRLLLTPKSPILPNLGGYPYCDCDCEWFLMEFFCQLSKLSMHFSTLPTATPDSH